MWRYIVIRLSNNTFLINPSKSYAVFTNDKQLAHLFTSQEEAQYVIDTLHLNEQLNLRIARVFVFMDNLEWI